MLTPPALSVDIIVTCLRNHFGLRAANVTFLPIGADVNAAVYRVNVEDDTTYFLKLRRGGFDQMAVTVPAFLHAHGIQPGTQIFGAILIRSSLSRLGTC